MKSIKTNLVLAVIMAVALPLSVLAKEGTENINLIFLSDGRIHLNGDSTLRKYSSTAKVFEVMGTAINKPASEMELPWMPTEVKMVLHIKNLKSGDETLDEHMQESLKFDKFPEIQLKLSNFSFTKGEDKNTVKAVGTLTVAGVSKPIELNASLKVDGDNLKIAGIKKILMSEFGITPPTMMMGALKTADEVEISFDVICSINNNQKG